MGKYKFVEGQENTPERSREIECPAIKPKVTIKALQSSLRGYNKKVRELREQLKVFVGMRNEVRDTLKAAKKDLKLDITIEKE